MASLGSALPSVSTARTAKVCRPSASPERLCGEEHARHAAASSLHSKPVPGSLAAKEKPAPVVRTVPAGPPVIVVSGGSASTVQACSAGVWSRLPAASCARTRKSCAPFASPVRTWGDVQSCHAPSSSRHSKPAPASPDPNANSARLDAVVASGAESKVVSGSTVSTIQVRAASLASTFPAASVARTRRVCSPWASPVSVRGEVQACQAPESSLHSKLEPVSFDENPSVAEVDAVGPVGPESIVVSGATVSTVQVRAASLASALPAASRARTRKVWLPSPSPVERAR